MTFPSSFAKMSNLRATSHILCICKAMQGMQDHCERLIPDLHICVGVLYFVLLYLSQCSPQSSSVHPCENFPPKPTPKVHGSLVQLDQCLTLSLSCLKSIARICTSCTLDFIFQAEKKHLTKICKKEKKKKKNCQFSFYLCLYLN